MHLNNIHIEEKNENVTKEIPDTFDHHILLYAKGWYKKSGNIIEDLKKLLSKYAGLYPDHIYEGEIKRCLVDCFAKYCPDYERGEAIQEMLGWKWGNNGVVKDRKPEEVMIGKLSIAEGKYVDPTKLLPILVKEKNNG